MNFAARVAGIVISPRRTMADVAASPQWASVLCLTTMLTFLSSAALLRTEVGRLALVDQWERTAIAFGQNVDDGRYAALQELSKEAVGYAALMALLSGPVLTFGVAGAIRLGLSAGLKIRASYTQILGVVAHAGVILALRQLVAAPINYSSETLASPTTLVRFVSMLDEASPVARLLGVIDLCVVWWIVVLAIGVSALADQRAPRLALAFTGVYLAAAVLLALVMAASGGAL